MRSVIRTTLRVECQKVTVIRSRTYSLGSLPLGHDHEPREVETETADLPSEVRELLQQLSATNQPNCNGEIG